MPVAELSEGSCPGGPRCVGAQGGHKAQLEIAPCGYRAAEGGQPASREEAGGEAGPGAGRVLAADPGEHSSSGNLEPTRASARGPSGRQALGQDPGCQGRGCYGRSRAQPSSFRTPSGPGRPIPGPLSVFQEEGAGTLLETHRPEGAHLGRGERGVTGLLSELARHGLGPWPTQIGALPHLGHLLSAAPTSVTLGPGDPAPWAVLPPGTSLPSPAA